LVFVSNFGLILHDSDNQSEIKPKKKNPNNCNRNFSLREINSFTLHFISLFVFVWNFGLILHLLVSLFRI